MLPELPSIAEAQTLMRRGTLRPIDLVEHCLGRIHQFEDQIHAWVMVDVEGARNEAQRLGKMLDDGQEPVGPLHGIPIGIKDIIDVAGWPTLCGSKLREGHVAEKDAAVVANLRKAGAIILGKTVTTEWASFDPPPTRNPWNLNHTPGGSSSGSAAAVAMEMCMAALGTQTGGSIVRPASYCGMVGLKPGFGMLPLDGVFPFSRNLDHLGPIARTVGDANTLWPSLLPDLIRNSPEFPKGSSTTLRILQGGFLQDYETDCQHISEKLRDILGQQVHVERSILPDYFDEIHSHHRSIMAVEAAETHRNDYEEEPGSFSFHIRALIEEGRNTTAIDYALALRRQAEIRSAAWKDLFKPSPFEVILAMPSTPTSAPDWSSTGNPVFNSPWSFLGLASITIPFNLDADRLPRGLQLIGIGLSETFLMATASTIESKLQLKFRPALLSK